MIKFRAWDKVAKVMIYSIEQTYDGLGYFQENEDIEDYVSNISFECFSDWLENEQFVIMQSTGLFDKNGKDLFEGDIVDYYKSFLAMIKKEDGCFVIKNSKNGYCDYSDNLYGEIEVIGNIYENHDLLESVEE